MAHEAITPVFINGVLSRDSHELLIRACREHTPDTLTPHDLPVTLVNLGRIAVKGAPNASFDTADYLYERSSPQVREFLALVQRGIRGVMLGGTGITAVTLSGMNSSEQALSFRVTGTLEEVAKRRLLFIDNLRVAKKIESDAEPLFKADGPQPTTIGLRFLRQPGGLQNEEQDEAFYYSLQEAVSRIERLELFGQPRIEYGHTRVAAIQSSSQSEPRQVC